MTPLDLYRSALRRLDALVESGALSWVRAEIIRARVWEAGQMALREMEPTT